MTKRRRPPQGGSERQPEPTRAETLVTAPDDAGEQRVRVIRGIPAGGGRVIEPGTVLTLGTDIPYQRVRQFVEQRYIVALEPDAE